MAKILGKKKLLVIIGLVIIVLLVASGLYAKQVNQKTPVTTTETTQADTQKDALKDNMDDEIATKPTDIPVVDPDTLSSIAVEPLGVTVYYSKATPGFDYTIQKTADNTKYADFTSIDLVSTKCTDDKGLFASIIKNPASNEAGTTISQTVKVGADTYGLSLAGAGCTGDADLLSKYQNGFKEGFSSLTAL